jgi:hypothetical protein
LPLEPHPVDAILLLLLLEAAGLVLWNRLGGRGPEPRRVLPTLAAGFCLLLALRACLLGAAAPLVALCLAAALAAHLVDLVGRWPR